MLFLVGIKLDVKLIRSLGAVSLMTGPGQVAFTSVFGYLIGLALGLDHLTSVYVAVASTFSSTMFDGKVADSIFETQPVRLRDIAPVASPTQTNGPADN